MRCILLAQKENPREAKVNFCFLSHNNKALFIINMLFIVWAFLNCTGVATRRLRCARISITINRPSFIFPLPHTLTCSSYMLDTPTATRLPFHLHLPIWMYGRTSWRNHFLIVRKNGLVLGFVHVMLEISLYP